MTLSKQEKNQFLKDECLFLQSAYENFDRRALTIKGWVATACIAAFAVGFDQASAAPWAVAGFAALVFWFLEAKWKAFQYAYRDRIQILEAYFRNEPEVAAEDIHPLQIYRSWGVVTLTS